MDLITIAALARAAAPAAPPMPDRAAASVHSCEARWEVFLSATKLEYCGTVSRVENPSRRFDCEHSCAALALRDAFVSSALRALDSILLAPLPHHLCRRRRRCRRRRCRRCRRRRCPPLLTV